jgi:transcriptional regulator with XRE-family HTH domain
MATTRTQPNAALMQRIEERRIALAISDRELSLRVTGKPDFLRDMKRRGHMPTAEHLHRTAEELGVSVDWLLHQTSNPNPVHSEVTLAERHIPWNGPPRNAEPIPLVGTGDCADLAVCSESGQMVDVHRSSFDPDFHVRYIARPPALGAARDLYAIYFHGTSMSPRFEPGEVGIVDPRRPVNAGDYVLVQLRDADADATGGDDAVTSVLVKRLVRQSAAEVVLEQFNPPLAFALPRRQVARLHRILPQTELLF